MTFFKSPRDLVDFTENRGLITPVFYGCANLHTIGKAERFSESDQYPLSQLHNFPPSITKNFRRRSGAVGMGVMSCVASEASISSPMAQVPSTTPSAFAGVALRASWMRKDCSERRTARPPQRDCPASLKSG